MRKDQDPTPNGSPEGARKQRLAENIEAKNIMRQHYRGRGKAYDPEVDKQLTRAILRVVEKQVDKGSQDEKGWNELAKTIIQVWEDFEMLKKFLEIVKRSPGLERFEEACADFYIEFIKEDSDALLTLKYALPIFHSDISIRIKLESFRQFILDHQTDRGEIVKKAPIWIGRLVRLRGDTAFLQSQLLVYHTRLNRDAKDALFENLAMTVSSERGWEDCYRTQGDPIDLIQLIAQGFQVNLMDFGMPDLVMLLESLEGTLSDTHLLGGELLKTQWIKRFIGEIPHLKEDEIELIIRKIPSCFNAFLIQDIIRELLQTLAREKKETCIALIAEETLREASVEGYTFSDILQKLRSQTYLEDDFRYHMVRLMLKQTGFMKQVWLELENLEILRELIGYRLPKLLLEEESRMCIGTLIRKGKITGKRLEELKAFLQQGAEGRFPASSTRRKSLSARSATNLFEEKMDAMRVVVEAFDRLIPELKARWLSVPNVPEKVKDFVETYIEFDVEAERVLGRLLLKYSDLKPELLKSIFDEMCKHARLRLPWIDYARSKGFRKGLVWHKRVSELAQHGFRWDMRDVEFEQMLPLLKGLQSSIRNNGLLGGELALQYYLEKISEHVQDDKITDEELAEMIQRTPYQCYGLQDLPYVRMFVIGLAKKASKPESMKILVRENLKVAFKRHLELGELVEWAHKRRSEALPYAQEIMRQVWEQQDYALGIWLEKDFLKKMIDILGKAETKTLWYNPNSRSALRSLIETRKLPVPTLHGYLYKFLPEENHTAFVREMEKALQRTRKLSKSLFDMQEESECAGFAGSSF